MSVAETSLSHCWHVTVTQGVTAIGQGWRWTKVTARRDVVGGMSMRTRLCLNRTEQNSCYGPDTDTTSQCVVGRKCKWGGAAPTLSLFSGSLLTRPRRSLTFDSALERNLGGIVLAAPLVPSSKSLPSPPRFTPYYKHRLIVIMYLSNYCTNFLFNLSCKAL